MTPLILLCAALIAATTTVFAVMYRRNVTPFNAARDGGELVMCEDGCIRFAPYITGEDTDAATEDDEPEQAA